MSNKAKKQQNLSRKDLKILGRLLGYIWRDHKGAMVIIILSVLFASVAQLTVSLCQRFMLDDYIIPLMGQENPDFSRFIGFVMTIALIFITGVIATGLYSLLSVQVTQRLLYTLRQEMFGKMQHMPLSYLDQQKGGALISLFNNDVSYLDQFFSQVLTRLIVMFLSITSCFISMIVLCPPMILVTLILSGLMLWVVSFIGGHTSKFFINQQKDLASLSAFAKERMSGQRVIKVFNYEEQSKADFAEVNEQLFKSASKASALSNMMAPIVANLGNIQFVVVATVGGIMAINQFGGITLGIIASYLQMTKAFSSNLMQFGQAFTMIVMALAGGTRIFEMTDQELEIDNGDVELVNICYDHAGNVCECAENKFQWAWKIPATLEDKYQHLLQDAKQGNYVPLKGEVKFHDMSFGYVPEKLVLHHISLTAKAGQKVAFVGSTGAGKTTITNLINRFYEVTSGAITYDGIDVRDIKKNSLRKSLGIVLQDTNLFTGTIKENIRYSNPDASDEEVVAAAKLACADDFIRRLPDGYDTVISGTGEGLSQGQLQLLSIARAAVANPPVLILDEATSSIDTFTEAMVQQGMDNLMFGRTVFVIAHRLSTIRNSDVIMVLDHGRIIESGTHAELLREKGVYHQLYTGKLELD